MSLPLFTRATEDGVTFVLTPDTTRLPASDPSPALPLAATAAHAASRAGAGRAVPVPRRHAQVHRLQVLRRRLQRAERKSRGDQLAARRGNRGRLVSARGAIVHVDRLPSLPRADVPAGLSRSTPIRRTPRPASCCTAPMPASAVRYCTWNCSYGVPQYNPERGVVGKCDMCHGRLGARPGACVRLGVSERRDSGRDRQRRRRGARRRPRLSRVHGTGFPSGDQSVSTTRITLPENLPPNAKPVDLVHVKPGEPHWPLVVMTVFTQLSVGAFATIWILQLLGASTGLGAAALDVAARRRCSRSRRRRCTWAGRSTRIARSRCGGGRG